MTAKSVKWAAGNIDLLTSKSSLLVSVNIEVIISLQDGTVARVNGLSLNLNDPPPTISTNLIQLKPI